MALTASELDGFVSKILRAVESGSEIDLRDDHNKRKKLTVDERAQLERAVRERWTLRDALESARDQETGKQAISSAIYGARKHLRQLLLALSAIERTPDPVDVSDPHAVALARRRADIRRIAPSQHEDRLKRPIDAVVIERAIAVLGDPAIYSTLADLERALGSVLDHDRVNLAVGERAEALGYPLKAASLALTGTESQLKVDRTRAKNPRRNTRSTARQVTKTRKR